MQVQRTPIPFSWQPFSGRIPAGAVAASDNYMVIRAYHANDWITGKFNLKENKAYIPYDSKEVELTSHFEFLVAAPGTNVTWVPASQGQIPQGAVGPIGKDQLFVGRAICPRPENVYTPGKVHPSHGSLYLPFDGKEIPSQNYEVCVIRSGMPAMTYWERFNGTIPLQAVFASKDYVVIRAPHQNNWIPGKLNTKEMKAYVAHDSKEVEVNSGFEVLLHAPGTEVRWVPVSDGKVPSGAIGPFGTDGYFIGRAVCPKPENVYTPGKIHPSHNCLYMPFDGKELNFKTYEALIIVPGRY